MPLHASDTGELFKNKKFQTNSALFLFFNEKNLFGSKPEELKNSVVK